MNRSNKERPVQIIIPQDELDEWENLFERLSSMTVPGAQATIPCGNVYETFEVEFVLSEESVFCRVMEDRSEDPLAVFDAETLAFVFAWYRVCLLDLDRLPQKVEFAGKHLCTFIRHDDGELGMPVVAAVLLCRAD